MMNILTKKRGKKGFTLMELLIVVAIIAILVAISIPVFTNQLEKARESTDVANVRAAKALAAAKYLTEDLTFKSGTATFYYDAEKGTLVDTAPTNKYGKGTATNAEIDTQYGGDDHTTSVIKVEIAEKDGTITCTWDSKTKTGA